MVVARAGGYDDRIGTYVATSIVPGILLFNFQIGPGPVLGQFGKLLRSIVLRSSFSRRIVLLIKLKQ